MRDALEGHVHACLRLLQRDPRLHAADQHKRRSVYLVEIVASGLYLWLHHERDPEVDHVADYFAVKAASGNANNSEGIAIHADGLTDDQRVLVEAAFPVGIADD